MLPRGPLLVIRIFPSASVIADAKRTGRRVFLQVGGTRCRPCFLFARWLEDHRRLVEKDYVVFELNNMLEKNEELLKSLGAEPTGGIPWTAITDAEGKILISSNGPLGNIGFPAGGVEGVRYFRKDRKSVV